MGQNERAPSGAELCLMALGVSVMVGRSSKWRSAYFCVWSTFHFQAFFFAVVTLLDLIVTRKFNVTIPTPRLPQVHTCTSREFCKFDSSHTKKKLMLNFVNAFFFGLPLTKLLQVVVRPFQLMLTDFGSQSSNPVINLLTIIFKATILFGEIVHLQAWKMTSRP